MIHGAGFGVVASMIRVSVMVLRCLAGADFAGSDPAAPLNG